MPFTWTTISVGKGIKTFGHCSLSVLGATVFVPRLGSGEHVPALQGSLTTCLTYCRFFHVWFRKERVYGTWELTHTKHRGRERETVCQGDGSEEIKMLFLLQHRGNLWLLMWEDCNTLSDPEVNLKYNQNNTWNNEPPPRLIGPGPTCQESHANHADTESRVAQVPPSITLRPPISLRGTESQGKGQKPRGKSKVTPLKPWK